MKAKILIIISIICCQLFISCREKNTSCEYLAKGDICVILKNRSGKNIKSLELKHERGKNEIINLANNENANISFNSPGESSYTITASFEDGKVVKSTGTYIEGGYKMTEIIHNDEIESKISTFFN